MKTALALKEPPATAIDNRNQAKDLITAFFSGKSKRTIEAYRQDLEDFKAFIKVENVNQATLLLISRGHGQANMLALRYKANLLDRGLSPATINRRLAALRSLVSLARTLGMIPWTLQVKNVKAKAYRDTRGPGVNGVNLLLNQVNGSRPKAVRDKAIIRLLYDLALRVSEVVNLNLEDINLERATVEVKGKGQLQKVAITLPAPTVEALAAWLDVRGQAPGPLFTNFDHAGKGNRLTRVSIHRIIKRLGMKAGIKAWPHGLRHTAITEAVKLCQEKGYPLEVAQDYSRHQDIRTLLIYRDRQRNYQGEIAGMVAGTV